MQDAEKAGDVGCDGVPAGAEVCAGVDRGGMCGEAAAARHAGAARTVVTDLRPGKLERAQRLGADVILPADAPDLVAGAHKALGGPVDVVFDCVSRAQSMEQAVELAANR
ncbi:zinc-binding dehydrogenase [Streptomyces sp. NPDC002577]